MRVGESEFYAAGGPFVAPLYARIPFRPEADVPLSVRTKPRDRERRVAGQGPAGTSPAET